MEEKQNEVEALRSEVENLKKELDRAMTLVKCSQDTAEKYKGWWLQKIDEINSIKGDMSLVYDMYKKLSSKW